MNRPALRAERVRRHLALYTLAGGAILAGTAARAGEIGVGAGAGADRGRTDCVADDRCDHGDVFGKLFASYGLDSGIELRATAFDAGRFRGGDTTPLGTPFGGRFKVSGVGLTAGYRWTFAPRWSLLGQAGVASVRTRFDYAAPFSGHVAETRAQPLVGLGLAYDVAPGWRLSLDYDETRFKVYTTHGSLRLLGASAQYVF
jgi:opacity protein-like surface antigen